MSQQTAIMRHLMPDQSALNNDYKRLAEMRERNSLQISRLDNLASEKNRGDFR